MLQAGVMEKCTLPFHELFWWDSHPFSLYTFYTFFTFYSNGLFLLICDLSWSRLSRQFFTLHFTLFSQISLSYSSVITLFTLHTVNGPQIFTISIFKFRIITFDFVIFFLTPPVNPAGNFFDFDPWQNSVYGFKFH